MQGRKCSGRQRQQRLAVAVIGRHAETYGIDAEIADRRAQPLMQRFGVPATARASFAFYNTLGEVDALAAAIEKVQKVFAG